MYPNFSVVKTTERKKVGILSKAVEINYVNQINDPQSDFLWKSPVDKPVEIVEKFGFSTG